MRHLAWIVVWVAAGCAGSNQVECSDGTICPDGTRCAQVTLVPMEAPASLCVTAGQLDACVADETAGKACAIGDVMPVAGTCHDHVCLADACGNHLVDSTEICDDGNTAAGDGCSSDCRSDELCGNAHVDPLRGESCDDGNPIGRDGCAASCIAETSRWSLLAAARPTQRDRYAFAFDVRRHRTLLFGGADSASSIALGGTFEWDGARQYAIPTSIEPVPRRQAAMAYDSIRHVTVLFGGYNGSPLADTWEWDGATWTQRTPLHAPPPRGGHAMVFDPTRKAIVIFAGFGTSPGSGQLQDTWTWNGTDWAELPSTAKPPVREGHAMAYDPKRDVTVMFGGLSTVDLADLWELRASGWAQVTATGGPLPRDGHAMAFDGDEVIVAGGANTLTQTGETWSWNGTRWMARAALPAAMNGIAGAYDTTRDRVVVISTVALSSGGLPIEWDGAAWSSPLGSGAIVRTQNRSGLIAVAMPLRHEVLVYGGDDQGTSARTWLWNGDWRLGPNAAPNLPTPDHAAAATYDAQLGRVVMFGGVSRTNGVIGETWSWDGAVWTQGAGGPPARESAAMTYDLARHQIVIFGGANGVALGDTWLWNSATQTWAAGPAIGPSARKGAALAYDPIARKAVLFGGTSGSTALDQTWEWDGTAWKQVFPPIAPAARSGCSLAWDAARKRLVLFGGRTGGAGSSLLADTWEASRDPAGALVWTQLVPLARPTGRADHAMVSGLDGNGVVVLAGVVEGLAGQTKSTDVWGLQWAASTGYETCSDIDSDGDGLVGCADPDCWASCTPLCPPGVTGCDTAAPHCGDGDPNKVLESCYSCPIDAGPCAIVCGDFTCNAGETHASCPGDCP